MGFKVGMPVLKLVTGAGNGSRTANYRKILEEMGNERFSKSKTLDRTRSVDNVYMGFRAGKKCAEAIDDVLSTYRVKVKGKDGVVRERAMRSNQVIGFSWILKPPAEVTSDWDDATWQRFKADSLTILEDICPELFGGCSDLAMMTRTSAQHADTGYGHNLMMVSEHNDEDGRHLHGAGMPWTEDGRLCGKEVVCLPTFRKLNQTYPQRMRELGWDVDELKSYDAEEAEFDPEYKARHIAEKKAKKHGQSVNDYAAQKAREDAEAAVKARIAAEEAARDALQRQLEATRAAQRVREEADISIEVSQEAARADMEHAALMIELAAEQDAQALRDAILDDAEAEADHIRKDATRQVEAARKEADTIVETARGDAEAILTHADERATDIVSDARQKAVNATADAFVAISEARAKVEEREQAAESREREAREARDAYKAAESAYKTATPTVAGISPEEFAERLMGRLVTEATPRRNPMTQMANLADDAAPKPQQPEILGDRQTFNALKVVRGFINRVLGGIRQVAISVAREIAREQARTQVPDKQAVARARQAEKEFYANLVGSKTEMGGVSHGRGDIQIDR